MIKDTFEERILMGRLPSSPSVARRLVELARRETPKHSEIAGAIRVDPALTGRLLERARHLPRSPSGGPVETVEAAIERLGTRELQIAISDLSLVTSDGSRRCQGFDYEGFWKLSLARAIAAENVVRATGKGLPAAAYTLGLLADIGRLALASVYPQEYSALLATEAARDEIALGRLERERLEIDHATVARCLLEHWGLRTSFARAAQLFQGESDLPETESAETIYVTDVLLCAQAVAEASLEVEAVSPRRFDRAVSALRSSLGLQEAQARKICSDCERALRDRVAESTTTFAGKRPRLEPEPAPASPVAGVESPPQVQPRDHPRDHKGLRILAVDDDRVSLALLRRVLEEDGHEVKCASDGAEALRIAFESDLQAVVADWMMPRMDGIELCKALRCLQSGREIFFLLLTGRDTEDQIVEAYDAGVDEYVTKPFNPRILLARIRAGQRIIELKREVDAERMVVAQQVRELGLLNRRLHSAALTDSLTGLPNRRCAWDRLTEEWEDSGSGKAPLSVMMIDIDRFKKVNDRFGHEVGDLVLKNVAEVLRGHARSGEDVVRLGGEEFLVICPNTTAEQAMIGAERLREAVEKHVIQSPEFTGGVTVSLGVAERIPETTGIDSLLRAADDAVYGAKSDGRNRVRLAGRTSGKSVSA